MKRSILITNIAKIALIFLGALITINGIVAASVSNLNLGLFFTLGLGIFLIAYGIFFSRIPKWARLTVLICLCIVAISSASVFTIGVFDSVTYEEDAVIVLGAGLRGDTPSRTLKNRLDQAVRYYEKNTDCIIVVAGGKGTDEKISEALAMERYLIEKGIPKDIIIKEDTSTSTVENFKNSKAILDGRLGKDYRVAIITNDFHIFRATAMAKRVGFESPSHLHSPTPLSTALPSVLRECAAILKFFVSGS